MNAIPKINAAIATIQQSLFVPKGNTNKFGGYNYRSCEDILRAVKPLLAECRCALRMTEDMVQIGDRIYAKATAIVTSTDDGSSVDVSAFAMEPESRKGMDAAQVSGSSLSYARKYALAGLFGIDNERDPDATNDGKHEEPAVDCEVCPCGSVKGKRWSEISTDTLRKILATPAEKAKSLTPGHRNAIVQEISVREAKREVKDI